MIARRVAQAFDLVALPTQGVPRSFAFFAKGGSRKCRRQVGSIPCPQQNQIAHAASPPTLARNARMGHPQWEWCTQRSLKVGHPPKKRKDGAPSVGIVHAKIVKAGPHAFADKTLRRSCILLMILVGNFLSKCDRRARS